MYDQSPIPIRQEIISVHEQQVRSITSSGTWWSGAERLYFALEARNVTLDRNHFCQPPNKRTRSSLELETARKIVSTVAGNGKFINQDILNDALGAGLSEGEYVEIIGVTTRAVCMDIFNKGIGLPCLEYLNPKNQGLFYRRRR